MEAHCTVQSTRTQSGKTHYTSLNPRTSFSAIRGGNPFNISTKTLHSPKHAAVGLAFLNSHCCAHFQSLNFLAFTALTFLRKAARAFWHFCAEVCRWQDDRECFVTVIHPSRTGFFSSQCSRSLKWRQNLSLVTFRNQGEQLHGELSFLTNLSEGSLDRLESLTEGYDSKDLFDPRFAVLLSHCVSRHRHSDSRQGFLFEDIFEDFEDGALCSLCLRSERNAEALSVLPSSEEYSLLSNNSKGKLPRSLHFVAPQRFVTSSLVQTLSYVDKLLPGTELEVHTTTSSDAVALRPMMKNVRVLTLPYLEFEYCNVYRGTFGKTLPVIHRHPDAVVILWNPGDHDHVFFVTIAQLLPCLQEQTIGP